jgi:hypothetical protein
MKRLIEVLACALVLGLPLLAQVSSPAQHARMVQTAFGSPSGSPQDQDDRNPNWDADRDREWHREHDRDRDHDRDRNWDSDRDRNWHHGYQRVLAPEWQGKFDSYYQRWLNYRATNNQGEMRSMEKRMQDIMRNYNIPSNVPYGEVASQGGGYR